MSADLFTNLGPTLTGLSEILGLVGAGIGFLIRSRRNAKRERQRTTEAAQTASQEVRDRLEGQLADAHAQDLRDRDAAISNLRADIRLKDARIQTLTDRLMDRDRDK